MPSGPMDKEPQQLDMFDEPVRPGSLVRAIDPPTSHESARRLKELGKIQMQVLACIAKLGRATDLEINTWCNANFGERAESTYRKRRGELVDLGLVADTGLVRMQAGRNRAVWELTVRGARAAGLIG